MPRKDQMIYFLPVCFTILMDLFIPLRLKADSTKVNKITWDAKIKMINFEPHQEKKVLKAVRILKKIITSDEFKERIINFNYNGKRNFIDNKGISNQEVYQKILEGAEQIGNTSPNNLMDVELELYHQSTTTIGYTYPDTSRIWINKKYFTRYSPAKVADNLMHEWMHKLGFTHETKWSKDRDNSVPYAVGYLVEELAQKIMK